MTEPTEQRPLALVTIPPALEEMLIDMLLGNATTSAFTSVAARGHGSDHERLSLSEQVSGRRKQKQFQIELAEPEAQGLLTALIEAIPGGDFHCCFLPLYPLSSGNPVSGLRDAAD